MGNCSMSRIKKNVGTCVECDAELEVEQICDVCLSAEMRYLDNLKYIHSFGSST